MQQLHRIGPIPDIDFGHEKGPEIGTLRQSFQSEVAARRGVEPLFSG